jgi:uncharacterized C2H2 Zn-finger protein
MRNFLRSFMIGRYGPDHLGIAIIILSFTLSVLYAILGYMPLMFLSYVAFALVLYRMLSRDIYRRRAENDKFIRYWWPVRTKIKRVVSNVKHRKTHRFFKCPRCKNTLRIPKGTLGTSAPGTSMSNIGAPVMGASSKRTLIKTRGKLQITCPKCGERFTKKQ